MSLWSVVVVGLSLFSISALADKPAAKSRIVAVVSRAEWCSVCKTNGERAGKVIGAAAADGSMTIVVNDLTNDATAKKSQTDLKAIGFDKTMEAYSATGVIYLFDARTKKPLHQVTVANADAEIQMALDMAKKETSK